MATNIRIGDYVLFRNIKSRLNLMGEGILSDDVVAGKTECMEECWFQICLPRQYTAAMELDEFLVTEHESIIGGDMSTSTKKHLQALERGYINEQKLNEQYMKTKFGTPVRYGDTIQLLHVKSKKYLTIIPTEVAAVEKENIKISLDVAGSTESWLIVQPRFKINQTGDMVMSNAEVKLNVAGRSNEYVHCADKSLPDCPHEVNSSLEPTSWLLSIYQSSLQSLDKNVILTTDLVYLSDPETKSVLSVFERPTPINPYGGDVDDEMSDDDSMMAVAEEGEIVMEQMNKVVRSGALWMLQTKHSTVGGVLEWRTEQVRLRHVNTGKYLCMRRPKCTTDGVDGFEPYEICVTSSPHAEKGTLISIHELHATGNFLEDKRAVQLNHGHTYLERGGLREIGAISHYTCGGTRIKASATNLFIHKYDAEKVTNALQTKRVNSSRGGGGEEMSQQPLDVFVGTTIRNSLQRYYNAFEGFKELSVGNLLDCDEEDDENCSFSSDSKDAAPLERLWPSLPLSDDKTFYSIIDRVVYYLKGMPASADAPSIDDAEHDDDDAVNEFGEIIRNDALICKRQNMLCDQGTMHIILSMLNDLLWLVKREKCAKYWDEVCGNKAKEAGDYGQIDDSEHVTKLKNLLHMTARVSKALLTVLLQCVKRHSSNQMYVASHMHVVLGWVGIQPAAADVVRTMLSNNLELQSEHIGPNEIKIFVDQIRDGDMKLKSMYFAMLTAFCSCGGNGINRNQQFVMDAIFPVVDQTFVKMSQVVSGDMDSEKPFFSNSLYQPKEGLDEKTTLTILGSDVLKSGMPYLYITWSTSQREYMPNTLFGREVVALTELFRGQNGGRENDAVQGTLQNVLRKSPIKHSRSGSFMDTSQRRRMMSVSASNSYNSIASIMGSKNITTERVQVIVSYLIAQMDLVSELCLDRNYMAITEMEKLFPYEILLCILSGHSFTSSSLKCDRVPELVGAASRLIKNLYVDRESESTSRMPNMSILASSLKDGQPQLASVESTHVYRFALLQHILSEHIKHMPSDGKPWDSSSLHMACLLKKLIQLQFYGTEDMLRDVIGPLMVALNRKNAEMDSGAFVRASEKQKSVKNLRDLIPTWQKSVLKFMESMWELALVMVLVVISTAVSIVQVTQGYEGIGYDIWDIIVLLIFVFEVSMRGYCHYCVRKNWSKFFNDHFVQLDIAVVLLDIIVMGSEDALGDVGQFSSTLRAIRLLRLLRVIRAARILKTIVKKDLEVAEKWALPERYRSAPTHELQTMVEMVDILSAIQKLLDDRNIRYLMKGFSEWSAACPEDNEEGMASCAVACFKRACSASNELQVSNAEYDDILLDLLMYVHPDLTQSVLDLLMAHHSSVSTTLSNASSIQILVSSQREKQFHLVHDLLLELDRNIETFALWHEVKTPEHRAISDRNIEILNVLIENCRTMRTILKFDESFEPDVMMQTLLRNFGCWDVTLKLLRKLEMSLDSNTMSNASRSTIAIMSATNQLLYWYVYGNHDNQHELFEELDFFFNTLDRNISSHNIITAIFVDNESLMKKVPIHRIGEFAERIAKIGKFPQYLTLMSAITCVRDRNILENQYEIVKQISSPLRQKKILTFCCPTSHPDYAKKVKLMASHLHKNDISADEVAAELAYHIQLLRALSGCTVGMYNITTIETKVQAMFYYVDVIDAILDKQSMLIIKIETGLFLYNAILEVEMLLPGLVYSPAMWRLVQHCMDILSTAKDDLRNVERNGWSAPTVSRRKMEYIMVCIMIVKGFFRVYFDPVVFRREHTATFGSQSNQLTLSMRQIDGMITTLFDLIRGVYEMDSPILSQGHKQMVWNALEALSKARDIKLTDCVTNTHTEGQKSELEMSLLAMQDKDRQENEMCRNLKTFMKYLEEHDSVTALLKSEFQSMIDKLASVPRVIDTTSTSTVRYEPLLKKLVDHFKGSVAVIVHSSGKEKYMSPRVTKTAIWLIRMFRTMIENAWGMTIDNRDDDGGEEQDVASAPLVQTFNTCGATSLCLDLIAAGIDRDLVLESIKLAVAMLFKEGGALSVQQTMHAHLSGTDSELFFLQLRKTIQDLITWHEYQGIITVKDDDDVYLPDSIITVRFIQLMCEGHFKPNQDIMREQEGKRVSINLLDDMVAYMVALSRLPCKTSTKASLAIEATILEVIQGPCEGNQDYFALNTSLVETLNHQMRARMIGDCELSDELELKKTGIDIFQGLLEGQGHKKEVYERVLSVIHLDVIEMLCKAPGEDISQMSASDDPANNISDESSNEGHDDDIEIVLRTESLVLLQMLCDYKPSLRKELTVIQQEEDMYVGGSVACVEIMWRGELQRRFFNIPGICHNFTDSARTHFVANVDRSSQEKKLLDMYARARVIYTELLHHKFLKEINVSKIFSRQNQNYATWITFCMCCAINVIFLIYYDGVECLKDIPEDEMPSCDAPTIEKFARNAINILNTFQIIFSSFTLVLFLIVRAPVNYFTYRNDGCGILKSIMYTAIDPFTLYYFVYVILAVVSLQVDHILTLLLLDIVMKNSYAMDVLIAIFTPIKQLAMACVLCIVVMYIFSMVLVREFILYILHYCYL